MLGGRWKQCLWASPVSGEIDSQDDHDVAEDFESGGMGSDDLCVLWSCQEQEAHCSWRGCQQTILLACEGWDLWNFLDFYAQLNVEMNEVILCFGVANWDCSNHCLEPSLPEHGK